MYYVYMREYESVHLCINIYIRFTYINIYSTGSERKVDESRQVDSLKRGDLLESNQDFQKKICTS